MNGAVAFLEPATVSDLFDQVRNSLLFLTFLSEKRFSLPRQALRVESSRKRQIAADLDCLPLTNSRESQAENHFCVV